MAAEISEVKQRPNNLFTIQILDLYSLFYNSCY